MSDFQKEIHERNAAQRLNILKGFSETDNFFEKGKSNGSSEAAGESANETMDVSKEEKDVEGSDDDEDELEKAGTGSKGGNVVGYDKHGKPIYASAKAQANKTGNDAHTLKEKIAAAAKKSGEEPDDWFENLKKKQSGK